MQNSTLRNSLALVIILVGGLLIFFRQPAWPQTAELNGDAAQFHYVADVDFWQRTDREQVVVSAAHFDLAHNLNDVPLQLGGWQGRDVPETNQEVFILLEPEQFVRRLYQDQAGHYLWLTLIGGRNSRAFHPVDLCYEADGWQNTLSSRRIPLNATDGLYGLWLEAQKSPVGGGTMLEDMVFYFYLFPDNRRDPAEGIVFFKITSPRYGSTPETLAVQGDFLRALFSRASATKGK